MHAEKHPTPGQRLRRECQRPASETPPSSCSVCLYGSGCEYLFYIQDADPMVLPRDRDLFHLSVQIDQGRCPHFEEG